MARSIIDCRRPFHTSTKSSLSTCQTCFSNHTTYRWVSHAIYGHIAQLLRAPDPVYPFIHGYGTCEPEPLSPSGQPIMPCSLGFVLVRAHPLFLRARGHPISIFAPFFSCIVRNLREALPPPEFERESPYTHLGDIPVHLTSYMHSPTGQRRTLLSNW